VLIATWNVNSLNARMPRVEEWLAAVQPDVLCLQETKMTDAQFPALEFSGMGYESAHHGQGRWNGVAILSRVGLEDVVYGFDDGREPDPDARVVWATCGGVRVASVYVPNGRELTDPHYEYKLDWLGRLRNHLDAHHTPDEYLVVLGDWNVIPTDDDVWNPAAFEGATHVSQPERDAVQHVKDWGLVDTLRERYPEPGIYSYRDYRNLDFPKGRGIRIDYLLSSRALAERLDRGGMKVIPQADAVDVLFLSPDPRWGSGG
jgi:exodeoxyribonuclease-3